MAEMHMGPDRRSAERMDAGDELATFRDAFVIADPELVYMDGNSLGRLPKRSQEHLRRVIDEEWGEDLIEGWHHGWYEAPTRVGDTLGVLLGAAPGQVLVTDSTSVDLFKLTMAALELRADRRRIVSDDMNFPTDLYVFQGCARILGDRHELVVVDSMDGAGVEADREALLAAIDEETALVSLSHPTFKSAYMYDIPAITARAHEVGALVLWDFCHAVGAVPLALDDWGVDMAVGCTYKYVNGGPGAPAFLYVRRELQDEAVSPIWGWWAHTAPFRFDLDYQPVSGIRRFLAGTPPMLSLSGVESAVDVLLEAGIERLRAKSVALTEYLIYLTDTILAPLGFSVGSPRQAERRGSHVSIRHPEGYRISRALMERMKVIPDFREPDNIRLGVAPLYTRFVDVWEAVDRIRRVVEDGLYEAYSLERREIT